ncbi:hypothetical protein EVAR_303_1, partial [Eumeta japonica]
VRDPLVYPAYLGARRRGRRSGSAAGALLRVVITVITYRGWSGTARGGGGRHHPPAIKWRCSRRYWTNQPVSRAQLSPDAALSSKPVIARGRPGNAYEAILEHRVRVTRRRPPEQFSDRVVGQ